MTREEAIELLTHMMIAYVTKDQYGDYNDPEPYEQAIDMAIEALSVESNCKDCKKRNNTTFFMDFMDDEEALDLAIEALPIVDLTDGKTKLKAEDWVYDATSSADTVSREEYEEVKAYMDTLVDAFIEDGEELAESVKVIRCKDCRWWQDDYMGTWCSGLSGVRSTNADDFCSWGERREE